MEKINFKMLSNSEINIKLIELENKYENIKNQIRNLVQEMNEIDKIYTEGTNIFKQRTKGIIL